MFNDEINEFISTFDKVNTVSMYRSTLKPIAESENREEVISSIRKLENMKIATRKSKKSSFKKFFEYINDEELINEVLSISDIETDYGKENYFFNVLEIKNYIDNLDFSPARKTRSYIYAYMLFLGIDWSYLMDITIYEYDIENNIISHNGDIYDVTEMDTNNTIRDAFTMNKYGRAIDLETGEYIPYNKNSYLERALVGSALLRTFKSNGKATSVNSLISNEIKTIIAKSGAFIRTYNRIKDGTPERESFELMLKDIKKIVRYIPTMGEYKIFERLYKEAGY